MSAERESLLQVRDARLRSRAREAIRYELEGAAKDGCLAPDRGADESWDELCHGRDVLDLLRERDAQEKVLEACSRLLGSSMPAWRAMPVADSGCEACVEASQWRERTRYLLTTDPADWQPEVIKWLA